MKIWHYFHTTGIWGHVSLALWPGLHLASGQTTNKLSVRYEETRGFYWTVSPFRQGTTCSLLPPPNLRWVTSSKSKEYSITPTFPQRESDWQQSLEQFLTLARPLPQSETWRPALFPNKPPSELRSPLLTLPSRCDTYWRYSQAGLSNELSWDQPFPVQCGVCITRHKWCSARTWMKAHWNQVKVSQLNT